jgi:glycosyltransferase 2 family protein
VPRPTVHSGPGCLAPSCGAGDIAVGARTPVGPLWRRIHPPSSRSALTPTRWILTVASFAAAIAVSIHVISSSWPAEGAPLGLPYWTHALALGAVALEILMRAAKIHFSARAIGYHISLGTSARTILGGDFAASITPSRSGAEPARFLVLTEARTPVAGVLLTLFLELFLEMLSLALVAAALAAVLRDSGTMVKGLLITVLLYSVGVLGAGAFAYSLARRRASGPPPGWVRLLGINAGAWRRVQRSLRQLRNSVTSLRTARRGPLLLALLFSVLHVMARLISLPLIVYAYGGKVPLGPLLLWPLLLLYGAAVAPAPGGGGVVEFAFNATLGGTLPPRLLGASLIWWRVYSFYIYIVIGAFAAGRTVMRALQNTGARGVPDAEEVQPA